MEEEKLYAIKPTAETVATVSSLLGSSVSVSQDTWTKLANFTVPSGAENEHESYFVNVNVQIWNDVSPVECWESHIKLRVGTSGTDWYPSDSGTYNMLKTEIYSPIFACITIPKDVRGETIEIWFKKAGAGSQNYKAVVSAWGHSPHRHKSN